MALTHIGQTFNADPFLNVTQYDTVAKTAVLTSFDPPVVARPSVVKFTKDQNGLLLVTDRIPAGVKVIQESPSTGNNGLAMSADGRTLVEAVTLSGGFNVYRRQGSSFKKVNNLLDPTYSFVGVSDDGAYFVLWRYDFGIKIYKWFGSSFIADPEFAVGVARACVLVGDRVLYETSASTTLVTQRAVYGGAEATFINTGNNFVPGLTNISVSNSKQLVAARMTNPSTGRTHMYMFKKDAGTGHYVNTGNHLATDDRIIPTGMFCINDTDEILLAVTYESGTRYRLRQWIISSAGAISLHSDLDITTTNQSSFSIGFIKAPPGHATNEVYMCANGIGRALMLDGATYGMPFPGSANMTPSGFACWLGEDSGDSDWNVVTYAGSGGPNFQLYTATSEFIANPPQNFPEYDVNFPVAGGLNALTAFTASLDGAFVAYVHDDSGVQTLYAGSRDNVSPLGTYITYYDRSGTTWEAVGVGEHEAGFTVRNVVFRGVDGNAVSYFLSSGPDDAVEGRYVYDGSNGTNRIFELKGEVLDPALQSTFIEFGWDDYFVATYDYSDARPSALKLYQFTDLGMAFTEKDSLDIVYGPVTLTNCWDIIVANGPLSNPFTLYKRDGDTIVTQAPLSIQWFEEYGTITDMVALEDCTGFIVVTDENKVIVIEVPPVDPENPEEPRETEPKDIIDLFPEPEEDLVDPSEPVEEQEQPVEPPEEIELDPETGQLVVTYPPNPNQPAPGQEGQPGQPSAPVYPPLPVPMGKPGEYPPGTVPPPPPGVPNPPQMVTNPAEGGGELYVIARTARVSVNFAFER